MAGLLSKGIKLSYKTSQAGSYTEITGLQEVPDMGGAPEKVDVTTLADGNRVYIAGIKDFGDLEFTFLYDNSSSTSNYRVLKGLEDDGVIYWQVEFPDALSEGTGTHHGTQFDFTGEVACTVLGQSVNSAIQFKATITLNSDIAVTNAA